MPSDRSTKNTRLIEYMQNLKSVGAPPVSWFMILQNAIREWSNQAPCPLGHTPVPHVEVYVDSYLTEHKTLNSQRCHIDDKSIPDIAFCHALVSFIDFLNRDSFNICKNLVLATEI